MSMIVNSFILFGSGGSTPPPPPPSPELLTLLHFDSIVGSHQLQDEVSGNQWIISNDSGIDFNEKKYGLASLKTSIAEASFADPNGILNLGTRDFIMRFKVAFHAADANHILMSNGQNSWNTGAVVFMINNTSGHNQLQFITYDYWAAHSGQVMASLETDPILDRYYDITMTRNGNTVRLFKDGMQTSETNIGSAPINLSAFGGFFIGTNKINGAPCDAHLDDFALIVNQNETNLPDFNGSLVPPRFTLTDSAFTPPTYSQTYKFSLSGDPFAANVVSLLNFNDSGNTITDDAGRVWTSNNVSIINDYYSAKAGVFPANTGNILSADDNIWDMHADGFTMEWFLSVDDFNISSTNCIISKGDVGVYGESFEYSFEIWKDYLKLYWGTRGINQCTTYLYWPKPFTTNALHKVVLGRSADGTWHMELDDLPYTQYQTSPLNPYQSFGSIVIGAYINNIDLGNITGPVSIGTFGASSYSPYVGKIMSFRYTNAAYRYDLPSVRNILNAVNNAGNAIVHTVNLIVNNSADAIYPITITGLSAVEDTDYSNLSLAVFSNGVTYSGGDITVPTGVSNFTITIPTLVVSGSGHYPVNYLLNIGGKHAVGTIADPVGTLFVSKITPWQDPATYPAYVDDVNVHWSNIVIDSHQINGKNSLDFRASSSSVTSDLTDFNMGTGDFYIEAVVENIGGHNALGGLFSNHGNFGTAGGSGWAPGAAALRYNYADTIFFYHYDYFYANGNTPVIISDPLPLNTPVKFVLQRKSNRISFYMDDVEVAHLDGFTYPLDFGLTTFCLGGSLFDGTVFGGYINDFRMEKGVYKY